MRLVASCLALCVASVVCTSLLAQPQPQPPPNPTQRPKLVVGVVVDQMRWDFLYRYWSRYSTRGFRRLLTEGYAFHQAHFDYIPTYTGPGHASVYAGCGPAVHGVVGNSWYDPAAGKRVYCVGAVADSIVGVGTTGGKNSPENLLSTTWGDELRVATMGRSRVVSLSIKDRGAILPGGRMANAAYWLDKATGHFITSTYYRRELPEWLTRFNASGLADSLRRLTWDPLKGDFVSSTADDQRYETPIDKERATFPYNLTGKDFNAMTTSPMGNRLTLAAAKAALAGESLGRGPDTDVLAVSFSSPDYVGHAFGPHSREVEDLYVRLDLDMAELLDHLDRQLGRANYMLFLTADHGVKPVAEFLTDRKLPGGRFPFAAMLDRLEQHLDTQLGAADWLARTPNGRPIYDNQNIYLNPATLAAQKQPIERAYALSKTYLHTVPHVARVYSRHDLEAGSLSLADDSRALAGYYAPRSGDLLVIYEPGWDDPFENTPTQGTTHGSSYSYDTHVPVLFFGWRVKPGESYRPVGITDIAPTISALLQIEFPSGATGEPLLEVMESIRRKP